MPAEKPGGYGYWRDPVFLVSLAVYFLNREWIKPHLLVYSGFWQGHLNDLLLVPVALPLFLFVYHQLGLRPDNAAPRWWEIALHLLVWILFFEWFGPRVLHRGVGDPLDAGCYVMGGAIAWLIWHGLARSGPRRTVPVES